MHNTKMLPRLAALALVSGMAFAGESLVLTTSSNGTSVDPNYPTASPYRAEFQLHNFTPFPSTNTQIFDLDGLGFAAFLDNNGNLSYADKRDNYAGVCSLSIASMTNALVRFQRNPTPFPINGLPALTISEEVWNFDGTLYNSCTQHLTGINPWFNGGFFGGVNVDIGFINIFTTLVPLASRPPVTASRGDYTALTFDNTLTDSSRNGHNVTLAGATFVPTPNQVAVAIAKTFGAPSWTTWTTLRAGYPSQLDGTSSFSLADSSSAVSFFWQQTSGPSNVIFASATAGIPTITGLIFGSYTFNLQVTDVNNTTAVTSLSTGAAAYDSNGIVIPPDPHVTEIFGPQIAFGQNPWSYQDQQNLFAVNAQIPYQATHNDFSWITPGQGTVSYPFAGKGFPPGPPCTSLSASLGLTDQTISIQNGSCLSLSSLPTWILVGNLFSSTGAYEQIRVCSVSSGSITAAVVLNVCYDGRGVSGSLPYSGGQTSPGSTAGWPAGTKVGEFRIQGTGTKFVTDPNKPACPAGAPGPMGTVAYSTGTVTLTAGSPVITGSGVTFTPQMASNFIRVTATYNSGASSYVFWAQGSPPITQLSGGITASQNTLTVFSSTGFVTTPFNVVIDPGTPNAETITVTNVNGTTWTVASRGTGNVSHNQFATVVDPIHFIANRPVPTLPIASDSGPFSYALIQQTYLSLEVTSLTDSHIFRMLWPGMGCESETAMFSVPFHDSGNYNSQVESGVHYSYKVFLGEDVSGGTITPNFYGSGGLMPRSFYYRSGYAPALTLANSVDDFWIRDPEIGDGNVGGEPLIFGGGNIGAIVDLVLNPSTLLIWPNVEQTAVNGEIGNLPCNAWDSREGGYLSAALTLAANYDPNATNRAAFITALQAILARDQTCERNPSDGYSGPEVNSFADTFAWNPQGPLTLTNGSTAGTGTNLPPDICAGLDTGTILVTNGSPIATVVSGTLTNQPRIYISDTITVPTFVGVYQYSVTGSTVTLATPWPGASGTFSFMDEAPRSAGNIDLSGIWTSNQDWPTVSSAQAYINNKALEKAWACVYNSSSSITLNRPWDSASGSSYFLSHYTIGTFFQQPFTLGVRTNQMVWATHNSNAAIAAGYLPILANVGNWFVQYGYDSVNNHGTFYSVVSQACEPTNIPVTPGTGFSSTHGSTPLYGDIANCAMDGPNPGAVAQERVNSVEGGVAMMQYYLANPTPVKRAMVDQFYGAVFGLAGSCAPSVANTCDGTIASNYTNNDLSAYKWPGFFFGMGGFFTSTWPAWRNTQRSVRDRTVSLGIDMAGSASVNVIVTAPSGAVTNVACSTSPCAITVDDRLGSFWYQVQRLNGSRQVISTAQPVLLELPPQP